MCVVAQHPDKQRGDEAAKAEATAKFQAISAIHSLLSDADARAYYDETGAVMSADEYEKSPSFQMWVDYFARIFPKVTERDIAAFSDEYRFSAEEQRDVLATYVKVKGDMKSILDSVMLSTEDDEERFAVMIERAIASKELQVLPKWQAYMAKRKTASQQSKKKLATSDAKRKRQQAKKDKEAREAEELLRKIRGNQEQRASGGNGSTSALSTKRCDVWALWTTGGETLWTDISYGGGVVLASEASNRSSRVSKHGMRRSRERRRSRRRRRRRANREAASGKGRRQEQQRTRRSRARRRFSQRRSASSSTSQRGSEAAAQLVYIFQLYIAVCCVRKYSSGRQTATLSVGGVVSMAGLPLLCSVVWCRW